MATLNAYGPLTLVEVAKRKDPDGNLATIAEVLDETNEILQDAVFREANDTFSNQTTRRASLPTGSFRKLNEGVATESTKTVNLIDRVAILEAWSENDIEVINAFPNPQEARMQEARGFIEGMGQNMAGKIFYGNESSVPEEFTGLAPRMDALATTANVLNAGGSGGDTTSIYVVDWGPNSVYMIYPKNSTAGLEHKDKGIETVEDANGNKFEAYVDKFVWKAGLVVKHNKSIGRIANMEYTGSSNIFNEDDLITLMNRMTKGPGRRIYVNEDIMTQMEIRLKDKTNVNFTKVDGLAPGPVLMFKGVPVRQCDQILNTETTLS
ncbi:MAG: hypothetical protein GWN94_14005 [Phycisphaerae bacterium]|nr:hypothetical protein [Phycisphaerae bacterium]